MAVVPDPCPANDGCKLGGEGKGQAYLCRCDVSPCLADHFLTIKVRAVHKEGYVEA